MSTRDSRKGKGPGVEKALRLGYKHLWSKQHEGGQDSSAKEWFLGVQAFLCVDPNPEVGDSILIRT